MTLTDAIKAAGAHPLSAPERRITLTGAASDSRETRRGDIFVCIRGERTDGHLFASAAVRAGAAAILAERDPFANESDAHTPPTPVLLARDSTAALGRIGHAWRRAFSGTVIGITGTAGKTTVKELLARILARHAPTACNPLNLNTQVGLPLSLLNASGQEKFWVMEAGISRAGDMDDLGSILTPDMVIILNAGAAHLDGLQAKGVAWHKARLIRYLTPGGTALVSCDYPDLVREARELCPSPVFFSVTDEKAPYHAAYLGADGRDRGIYRLRLDGFSLDLTCGLNGSFFAENLIAAAAAAHLLGLDAEEITWGLENAVLHAQRFSRLYLPGWLVIDDSYNANPLSCRRMLAAMADRDEKPLVCVMGEMLELGDAAASEHIALGASLADSGARAVFWLGGRVAEIRKGLEQARFSGHFQTLADAAEFPAAFAAWEAREQRGGNGLILFKGSRGNRLEQVIKAFLEARSPEGEKAHAL